MRADGAIERAAFAAPDDLDPSFVNGGKSIINFGRPWERRASDRRLGEAVTPEDLALQANGGIILVGYRSDGVNDIAVARFKGDPPSGRPRCGPGGGSKTILECAASTRRSRCTTADRTATPTRRATTPCSKRRGFSLRNAT